MESVGLRPQTGRPSSEVSSGERSIAKRAYAPHVGEWECFGALRSLGDSFYQVGISCELHSDEHITWTWMADPVCRGQ